MRNEEEVNNKTTLLACKAEHTQAALRLSHTLGYLLSHYGDTQARAGLRAAPPLAPLVLSLVSLALMLSRCPLPYDPALLMHNVMLLGVQPLHQAETSVLMLFVVASCSALLARRMDED